MPRFSKGTRGRSGSFSDGRARADVATRSRRMREKRPAVSTEFMAQASKRGSERESWALIMKWENEGKGIVQDEKRESDSQTVKVEWETLLCIPSLE